MGESMQEKRERERDEPGHTYPSLAAASARSGWSSKQCPSLARSCTHTPRAPSTNSTIKRRVQPARGATKPERCRTHIHACHASTLHIRQGSRQPTPPPPTHTHTRTQTYTRGIHNPHQPTHHTPQTTTHNYITTNQPLHDTHNNIATNHPLHEPQLHHHQPPTA